MARAWQRFKNKLIQYIKICFYLVSPSYKGKKIFLMKESDFAITDLSQSRTINQIEVSEVKEALKKGCPFNFNLLRQNNCLNSTFNGIALTIDMINENPDKVRLYVLRSFGESFYHSITDALLEFGYKCV